MKISLTLKTGFCCALMIFAFSVFALAQEKPKLSDPEVAFVAVTANQIDIYFAGVAIQKSKDASVIEFANTMERDHKAVIAQATALAKKLGVTPKNNAVSNGMLANAEKTKKNLRSKSG